MKGVYIKLYFSLFGKVLTINKISNITLKRPMNIKQSDK